MKCIIGLSSIYRGIGENFLHRPVHTVAELNHFQTIPGAGYLDPVGDGDHLTGAGNRDQQINRAMDPCQINLG